MKNLCHGLANKTSSSAAAVAAAGRMGYFIKVDVCPNQARGIESVMICHMRRHGIHYFTIVDT